MKIVGRTGPTGLSASGRRKLVADRMNCCCGGGYKNVNCCCCGSCSNSSHGKSPIKKDSAGSICAVRAGESRMRPALFGPCCAERDVYVNITGPGWQWGL